MSIEIRHLRQFLAVAEELHFTRAAERLHLAQPALSAQIKKLEEELGLTLLNRNTRTVQLTSDGEKFAVKARVAIEAYDDALITASALRTGDTGHVSLGINPRFNPQVRMGILQRLNKINPGVTVDFVAESSVRLVSAVSDGQLDAAYCIAPMHTAALRTILVRQSGFVVAMHADNPLAANDLVTLTDLRDEKWILPSSRVFASNAIMQQRCLDAGFEMQVSSTATGNYDDEFLAVSEGNGIEVVPDDFVRAQVDPDVVFVPLQDVTIPLYLIAQPENESRALGAVFQAVVGERRTPRQASRSFAFEGHGSSTVR